MKRGSMRRRMTAAFILVLAPFLLVSSHLLLTILRNHNLGRNQDPAWIAFVIFTIVAIGLVALLVWWTVGKTLSPIRALAVQAEEAGADHPGVRLTAPSDDAEIGELVDTLNGLLSRIEKAAEEKARFYGAASHELRTPLQALSGHLEVALSQPRDTEELTETLAEAHRQTQRLSALVEGILLLHQAQADASAPTETVDLKEIVAHELDRLASLIEIRDVTVRSNLESTKIRSHPTHADVVVRNLLENAVKYGPQGGQVTITLESETLSIQNPLPPDSHFDPALLSSPFSRQEQSRSAKSGGNGLGLAICRAVAKANGWGCDITVNEEHLVTAALRTKLG